MPLLEFQGRTSAIETLGFQRLISPHHQSLYWAPIWGLVHGLGFHAGQSLARSRDWSWPQADSSLILLAAMLPLGLLIKPGFRTGGLVWATVFALSVGLGVSDFRLRDRRPFLAIPSDTAPSRHLEWHSRALVRTTSWARRNAQGHWKSSGVLVAAPDIEDGGPARGQGLMLYGQGTPPEPGDLCSGVLRFRVPRRGDLPGMFDSRQHLAGRGLRWDARVLSQIQTHPPGGLRGQIQQGFILARRTLLSRLSHLLPGPEGEMAGAILLGEATPSSRSLGTPYRHLGLAHLFAVSGLHVGILLGLVLLPDRFPGLHPAVRWWWLALCLPPYVLLTGLPGSVVRAAGLTLLVALARPLGRSGDGLALLGRLFWASTIYHPPQVLDTGVLLSYGAVAGILLLNRISQDAGMIGKGWRGWIPSGLVVSIGAQWGTLPVVAASFGRLNLMAPLANLVAIPLFGLAVWGVVVALVLDLMGLEWGSWLATWAWALLRGLTAVVTLLDDPASRFLLGLPYPGPLSLMVWLGASVLVGLGLHRVRQARWSWPILMAGWGILLAVYTGHLVWPRRDTGPEVWQWDVGQGDASLVRFPDGWTAMIDTGGPYGWGQGNTQGPMERSILPWLERYPGMDLDLVVLSHGHRDHTTGAAFLGQRYPELRYVVAGRADRGLLPERVHRPQVGEDLHSWQGWRLHVLASEGPEEKTISENDCSLVLALSQGDTIRYLWTGDLERRGESRLVGRVGWAPTSVWKAGHHGSHTSGTPPFLAAFGPRLIIISCGIDNRYGHPSHGPYTLAGEPLEILRTDRDGTLHFRWLPSGKTLWRARGGPWRRLP